MITAKRFSTGFTLYELLIASCILAVALISILGLYVTCLQLNEINRAKTVALGDLKSKMEEIKGTPFVDLLTTGSGGTFHNGQTFQLPGFSAGNATGRIEIKYIVGETFGYLIKSIRLVASYRVSRRVIGEDRNLNGMLDAGEDTNGNTLLDGPVELETYISK
ncbi:MAG TPA: hypothetical protein PLO85_05650 [Candidatus Omnitrophota bacterium]|nr:hypothetical protein [Candidatus Omnitrophota bacterium]